jgi:hypothetical protein
VTTTTGKRKFNDVDTWLPTTAAMEGFLLSPAGGCVTSAPRKMTGSLKIFGRMLGTWSRDFKNFFLRHR